MYIYILSIGEFYAVAPVCSPDLILLKMWQFLWDTIEKRDM